MIPNRLRPRIEKEKVGDFIPQMRWLSANRFKFFGMLGRLGTETRLTADLVGACDENLFTGFGTGNEGEKFNQGFLVLDFTM